MTKGEFDWLAEQFEASRSHLQGVAYRMLGSLNEAEDAVQETWIRFSRANICDVENQRGWLTTVTARVCIDMLRSRKIRREENLVPEFSEVRANGARWLDPEQEMIMADSVGLALLVVLDTLTPAERLAFVLHDMFGVPFDEVGAIVGRSQVAAKKLASRGRRRVQGTTTVGRADLTRHRKVVETYLAASRAGDLNALLAVLGSDVVRRADKNAIPPGSKLEIHGIDAVSREVLTNSGLARFARIAMVDGAVGLILAVRRQVVVTLRFTIEEEKITEINVIADPIRLRRLNFGVLGNE